MASIVVFSSSKVTWFSLLKSKLSAPLVIVSMIAHPLTFDHYFATEIIILLRILHSLTTIPETSNILTKWQRNS